MTNVNLICARHQDLDGSGRGPAPRNRATNEDDFTFIMTFVSGYLVLCLWSAMTFLATSIVIFPNQFGSDPHILTWFSLVMLMAAYLEIKRRNRFPEYYRARSFEDLTRILKLISSIESQGKPDSRSKALELAKELQRVLH